MQMIQPAKPEGIVRGGVIIPKPARSARLGDLSPRVTEKKKKGKGASLPTLKAGEAGCPNPRQPKPF